MSRLLAFKTRILVSDVARSRDWYRALLGLDILDEWDEPGDEGCILGVPGSAHEALLELSRGEAPGAREGLSLQFRVDDVDRFDLPADPAFSARGPVARPWGSRYLYLTDPDGIDIVLFSGRSL